MAPIAALRESAATDRPLTRITITGAIVTVGGTVSLVWGLSGAGGATLWLILAGVLALLVGVALLTPLISKPVVSVLGRMFSWSVPGKLGRRNSSRNPRRTAITAAAVMIGIALVTAISTVFASLSTSLGKVVDQELQADLVVSGQQTSEVPPTIQPDEIKAIRALPDVQTVAAATFDAGKIDGKTQYVIAYDDFASARTVLKLKADAGSIDSLGSGQLIVDRKTADDNKLAVGAQVPIALTKTGERTYTLVGITAPTNVGNGFTISEADAEAGFRFPKPIQAYVKVRDGADVNAVKAEIAGVIKNNPEVDVQTRQEYVGTSTQFFDVLLAAVQVLLPGRPGHLGARRHQHARAVGHRTHPRNRHAPRDRAQTQPDHADGDDGVGGDRALRHAARPRRGRRARRCDRPGPQGSGRVRRRLPAVGPDAHLPRGGARRRRVRRHHPGRARRAPERARRHRL